MSSEKKILFVDDEALVLDGLRRMLRSMRHEWNMQFATSGAEALERLEREPFNVVVSDMRMPGMNGAQLLNEVKRRHPATARLVLSGHADQDMIMESLDATHQYLSKPCEAELLRATIERMCLVAERAHDPRTLEIAGRLGRLPTLPLIYDQLVAKMREPEASISDIAAIVTRDPAMSAEILKIVNSAYFGIRRRVVDIEEAINFLGLDTLRSLVISVHAFSRFENHDGELVCAERLWDQSLRTAIGARAIAEEGGGNDAMVGETFVAGLVHDVGRLVLASTFPADYRVALRLAAGENLRLDAAEQRVLGMDHARVGAVLFGLWGLPDVLVETTAWHHAPSASGLSGFGVLTCVHLADAWITALDEPATDRAAAIDEAYLEANGFTDRVAPWRAAFDASAAVPGKAGAAS